MSDTERVWEGMYDHTIHIWFAPAREVENFDAHNKAHRKLQAIIGPTLEKLDRAPAWEPSAPWFRLTDNTCRRLAELLASVCDGKTAKVKSAWIEAEFSSEQIEKAQWFMIAPEADLEPAGVTPLRVLEVRADRIKGPEALRHYSDHVLASERLANFVRDRKLSGVEFIWCPDKGKFAAPQWYQPVAQAFLGRGIDHPWFDPATRGQFLYQGYLDVQPTDPQWQIGVSTFTVAQARQNVVTTPASLAGLLKQLKRVCPSAAIQMPPIMLRSSLPATDFAYRRTAGPLEKRPQRCVQLCCSASARRQLIRTDLANPGDFRPVVVLDCAPKGAIVFDRNDEPLPNWPEPQELSAIRQTEAKALAKFNTKPRPPMPIKALRVAKLIPQLKKLLKSQGAGVTSGAKQKDLAAAETKLGYAIPARWKELLSKVDGFNIDNCNALDGTAELRVASAARLVQEHKACRSMIQIGWPEVPKTYLGVASNDLSDAVFLDTTKVTPDGDCPVIFMDHEECRVVASWPAIGVFLSEAIEPSE